MEQECLLRVCFRWIIRGDKSNKEAILEALYGNEEMRRLIERVGETRVYEKVKTLKRLVKKGREREQREREQLGRER